MRPNAWLALWLAALLLATVPQAGFAISDSPDPREAATPARGMEGLDSKSDDPIDSEASLDSKATTPASGVVDPRRAAQRPEEFWWPSPEEILESLYGACGARDCCKYCVKGKACGNTCIERTDTCHVGCGCACQKPLFFGE